MPEALNSMLKFDVASRSWEMISWDTKFKIEHGIAAVTSVDGALYVCGDQAWGEYWTEDKFIMICRP